MALVFSSVSLSLYDFFWTCFLLKPLFKSHITKQNLLIAFTPLQLLVHRSLLASPQRFHHRPRDPITILSWIQSPPGAKLALGSACWVNVETFKIPCWTCCSGVNDAFIFKCHKDVHFLIHLHAYIAQGVPWAEPFNWSGQPKKLK